MFSIPENHLMVVLFWPSKPSSQEALESSIVVRPLQCQKTSSVNFFRRLLHSGWQPHHWVRHHLIYTLAATPATTSVSRTSMHMPSPLQQSPRAYASVACDGAWPSLRPPPSPILIVPSQQSLPAPWFLHLRLASGIFCHLFSPTSYETLDFYRFRNLPTTIVTVLYFSEPRHHPQAFLTFAATFFGPSIGLLADFVNFSHYG